MTSRNLLTLNYTSEKTHHGIIVARRHSPYEITKRLILILNQVTASEIRDQIRYIRIAEGETGEHLALRLPSGRHGSSEVQTY